MPLNLLMKQSESTGSEHLNLSEVISALSYALDLTEGQPAGHCIRCCWIGMHIGRLIGLPDKELWNLYYTLLLKDAGCSSNAARIYELYGSDDRKIKHDFKTVNGENLGDIAKFVFNHVETGKNIFSKLKKFSKLAINGDKYANEIISTRCERGADIAKRLGFNETIANGIRYLDEHWNGGGRPYHISGQTIPIHSRISLLAQVADVFFKARSKEACLEEVKSRRGSWFDPELVNAFLSLQPNADFWTQLNSNDIQDVIQNMEPKSEPVIIDDDQLDNITAAFGMIIDSKSPYTYNHSSRVEKYTLAIADELNIDTSRRHFLKRGAFLHDIGKLGVSNDILDKPGKLDAQEWKLVQDHAAYTHSILSHLKPFAELAHVAGAHHERLDGGGYPRGISAEEICLETRIITVADIFDAITAERPYRSAIPVDKTIEIMKAEVHTAIDEEVLNALINRLDEFQL